MAAKALRCWYCSDATVRTVERREEHRGRVWNDVQCGGCGVVLMTALPGPRPELNYRLSRKYDLVVI